MNEKTKDMPGKSFTETLPNGFSFETIFVEGGSFRMGSEDEEALDWEKLVHRVELSGFYIGKYPVTQALWKAVMGEDENPSEFKGDRRPVESVSWYEAQSFIQKLNGIAGKSYRLPTEAEWEYAARGGARSEGYKYAGSNRLKEVGWYNENSYGETKPVGMKAPNELGLYDMSGNVWEWVEDQWHESYEGAPTDGSAWVDQEEDVYRVRRGGSWFSNARICRVSNRYYYIPTDCRINVGFRLVLSLQSVG